MNRNLVIAFLAGSLVVAGCSVQSKHEGEHDKNVKIETPFGGMNVKTDSVEAKDTGIAAYPGATLKESDDKDKDEKKANVNIDTPWFGLKVVALTYESKDDQQKIWDFYKKDLAKYGRVLECRPGSADMDARPTDKEEVSCREENKQIRINSSGEKMSLKVGTKNKQRIVAIKPNGSGTEFSIVYVNTRDKSDTL
jgi:hypothetical protein